MTIQFSQDVPNIGGVNYTTGQQKTLDPQLEFRLVTLNLATWVGSPPTSLEGNFVEFSTDASGKVTGLVGPDETYPVRSAAYDEAAARLRQADYGTLLTDLSNSTINANGTPASGAAGVVTTDLPPVKTYAAVRLIGDAATRASLTSAFATANQSTANFRGIALWMKSKGRTAGPTTTQIYLGNGADPRVGKALAGSFCLPSDGKWHLAFLPRLMFSALNGFVLGTDTITSIGINDTSNAGGLGYPAMLTNAEELQLGPVYMNPFSRPKFLIRFDDSLSDCIVPNGTFTADGVTQAWSGYSLLNQYGFGGKGSCFHLTRRFNTSNAGKTFLTTAQLATLASYGWSHCIQSHQDPFDGSNNGLRLMGAPGYAARSIASVDTTANTMTTSVAHGIVNIGYGGYPIVFSGTSLPAPLVAGTVYWARQVTNTFTMTLHPTENDSIANTNVIDLTTAGTPANFTYRYGYSANDNSLQQADLTNAMNVLASLGYSRTSKLWAPNQGATSVAIRAAAIAAGVKYTFGVYQPIQAAYPINRHLHMETTGYYDPGAGYCNDSWLTVVSAIQTDGSKTAADVEAYIDAIIAAGGIGSNYHHIITASNGPVLAAYLARLRLRVQEGVCDVVTAEELMDYLDEAKSLTPGVVY